MAPTAVGGPFKARIRRLWQASRLPAHERNAVAPYRGV
jgi:hypothetical protein